MTSHAERTSPVLRGKWVLENLLGLPVPPPPPDVPSLKGNDEGEKPTTVREQLAAHRANPVCASCHKVMDPIGFALENFDAVGAWRTREAGRADRRVGPARRRHAGRRRRDAAQRDPRHARSCSSATMTEKLLTYALGPRRGRARHAGGARRRARRGGQGRLPVLVDRARHRAQRPVPDADDARRERGRDDPDGTEVGAAFRRPDKGALCSSPRSHLPRRTFLRGMGVAVSLPLLDAMVPALTALARAQARPRHALRRDLRAQRRDHGAVDPRARRRRLRLQADPQAARAVQGPGGRGRRT